jgi:hypothetical protein
MILENIRRNAREGNPRFGDIKKEDLRFKTWEEVMRYESNAGRHCDDRRFRLDGRVQKVRRAQFLFLDGEISQN